MASIPEPTVAGGIDIGAKKGLAASEFHSGPYHDIRNYGAVMDGSTDDSGAIEQALQKSADDGGAAYIPKGVAFCDGWRAVNVATSMDGATLVGEGSDSVIKGNSLPLAFYDGSHSDVTFANLRVDVSNGKRGVATPNDGSNTGDNLVFENMWVHGATENNFSINMGGSGTIATLRGISVWNASKWHGVSLTNTGGYVNVYDILAWENGLGDTTTGGHGVDPSGEYAIIDGFLFVDNWDGAKVTPENQRTEFRNGVIMGARRSGFRGAGDVPNTCVMENVMSRENAWEGFSFAADDNRIGRIWAIDNCQNPAGGSDGKAGVEWAYGPQIDAQEIQVCGTQNGKPGLSDTGGTASGTVSQLVASGNSGGTFGNRSNINYENISSGSCSAPSVKDVVTQSDYVSDGTVNVVDVIVDGANSVTIRPK